MSAPGTAAPDASATVPVIAPRSVCAHITDSVRERATSHPLRARFGRRWTIFPPRDPGPVLHFASIIQGIILQLRKLQKGSKGLKGLKGLNRTMAVRIKISSRSQGGSRKRCLKALRGQVFYDEPSTCATPSIGHAFWLL